MRQHDVVRHVASQEALAQDEDLVCKARVRICLYERFPRFRRFVLILRQPWCREATLPRGGGAYGFGIKGVADHIKAGDISSAPYPAGYEPAGKLRLRLFHINYKDFAGRALAACRSVCTRP